MKRWMVVAIVTLIAGFPLGRWHVVHADEDEDQAPITAPQRVVTVDGVTYVELNTDTQQAIGLKSVTLKPARYRASRRAYGRVVGLGPLLSDYRDLSSARAQVTRTEAKLDASHAEYKRLQGLYRQHRNVSKKELQAARATWLSDQAAATNADAQRTATKAQLEAQWGSPIAQWMGEDRSPLRRLLHGTRRLLRLTLPPGEVPSSPPRSGQVVLTDGTTIPVELVSPAPTTAPDIQGTTYYFLAHSHIDRLSYGLRITALLAYGPEQRGVIVPDAALVWSRGSAWIYTRVGKRRFERKPVRTDTPVPGGWFQATGLGSGSRIVTQGAQVLFSVQAFASASKGGRGGDEGDED